MRRAAESSAEAGCAVRGEGEETDGRMRVARMGSGAGVRW